MTTTNRVRITRTEQATVICPESWAQLPTDEVRTAMTPVAGGAVVLDARFPDEEMGAWLTDLSAAAWWLSGVFGEDVAMAVLDDENPTDEPVEAEWGTLARPLRRLAMASWLYRWWPSADPTSGVSRLDEPLLLAEIGTAAWQAEPCVSDDAVFTALLDGAALPVGKAIGRVADLSGDELDAAEHLVWTSARAVLEEGNAEQTGWTSLADVWRLRQQEQDSVSRLMAELVVIETGAAEPELALVAGAEEYDVVLETRGAAVDWLQVNPRMVANQPQNMIITIFADERDQDARRVGVQVAAGDVPAEEGLLARVYNADDPGLPIAQFPLVMADGVYQGSGLIDSLLEVGVDVYHRDHVTAPRLAGEPVADRQFVQGLVRERLSTPLANRVGPFAVELLGSENA